MRFTLRQIEHALALAEHRNFREAASALHISQPALTRSIRALEAAMGGQLFDRLSTGVEPTQAGAVFLQRALNLTVESLELQRDVAASLGLSLGTLSVACGPYPGEYLVPAAVGRLLTKHPELAYRLIEMDWGNIPESLLLREIDIAVADISSVKGDSRFRTDVLIDDPLYYVSRRDHPLAARDKLSFEQVQQYPLVANRVPEQMRSFIAVEGPPGETNPLTGVFAPRVEATTLAATKRVLLASDAVSLSPVAHMEADLRSGNLVILNTPPVPLNMNSGFIYLAERSLSPAAEQFILEVRAVKALMDLRAAPFVPR
jgi:DNA-binding transcriptional LysR family regulator